MCQRAGGSRGIELWIGLGIRGRGWRGRGVWCAIGEGLDRCIDGGIVDLVVGVVVVVVGVLAGVRVVVAEENCVDLQVVVVVADFGVMVPHAEASVVVLDVHPVLSLSFLPPL